jgi:hypothetical protein
MNKTHQFWVMLTLFLVQPLFPHGIRATTELGALPHDPEVEDLGRGSPLTATRAKAAMVLAGYFF